jgi:hypothetical protein
VVVVFANPDLQLAGGFFAMLATTIEEGFVDASDFGDVERDWNIR